MKGTMKRVVSILLALALVITSLQYSPKTVSAATAEELAAMVADADYNLALNKDTILYPGCAEGSQKNLNNGTLGAGGNQCALSSGWGYTAESYAIIDLGDYYDASSLDEIVIQYKDAADNDTVVSRSYKIQYSIDMLTYYDAVEETHVDALDDNRCTTDDVSEVEGTVRYVRVYYPTTATYGIQITEVAVFATNPEIVEIEECANPDAVEVSSVNDGEIIVNITAGEGQEGYKYMVYLDNATAPSLSNVDAGVEYIIRNVESGVHTVKVVSVYNGIASSGLVSEPVTVKTIVDVVLDGEKNLALHADYRISSGNSTEGAGSITNGIISTNDYATPEKAEIVEPDVESYFTIDLGKEYNVSDIDSVYVWYRSPNGGCAPQNTNTQQIQFSNKDENWITVATVSADDVTAARNAQGAPYYVASEQLNTANVTTVRYVRIYYPLGVLYGAQLTEVAVFRKTQEDETTEPPVVDEWIQAEVGEWTELGAYSYYVGANEAASYKGGSELNDFSIQINANTAFNEGTVGLITEDFDLVEGKKYKYIVEFDSTSKGSTLQTKIDPSENQMSDHELVEGANRIEVEFTAPAEKAHIYFQMGWVAVGTILEFTNVEVVEVTEESSSEEPSSEEPSSEEPSGTTSSNITEEELLAPTDVMLLDYHQTNEGYVINFTDNNADLVIVDGDTKAFEVYVGETLVGTVSKSGDTIESLAGHGFESGTQYAVSVRQVITRTNAGGNQETIGKTSTVKNYINYNDNEILDNGIAKVFVNTTRTEGDKNFNLYQALNKTKITSAIMIVDENGVSQVEGTDFGTIALRGNSTSGGQKRPYNIKFEEKQNIFGFGKAKKWSLLANTFDKSMIRNQIGIMFHNYVEENYGVHQYTSFSRTVDLYIDGRYLGTYSLIESVEAGSTRVDIDAENEDSVNNEILIELDSTGRDLGADAHLRQEGDENLETRLANSRYWFTINEPEGPGNANDEGQKDIDDRNAFWANYGEKVYFAYDYLTAFEAEISKGAESNLATIATMIDVESFVNFYITAELFKITDIDYSSTRFYIKGAVGQEKLYAGPLWDLDLSSGNNTNPTVEGLHAQDNKWFGWLMKNEDFAELVRDRYEDLLPQIKQLYADGGTVDTLVSQIQSSVDANYSVAYNEYSVADATTGYGDGWKINYMYNNTGEAAPNVDGVSGSTIMYTEYANYITDFKDWLEGRNAYLMQQLGAADNEAVYTEYEEMIADRFYNLALDKDVAVYKNIHQEGKLEYLNDGLLANGHAPLTNADTTTAFGTENLPVYFTIDLEAVYKASAIDEIFVQYKDGNANDTVLNKPYNVQFSFNGVDFYDVVSVDNATLDKNNRTIDILNIDKDDDRLVRYVRVYYLKSATYGMHIREAAVLDTDKDAVEVKGEIVPAPAAVAEVIEGFNNQINVTITAANDVAEGTTYVIYVDGKLVKEVDSAGEHILTDIKIGNHTVTVKAKHNGWESELVNAGTVIVTGEREWVPFKNTVNSTNIAATRDVFYVEKDILTTIIGYNGTNVGLFANTASLDQSGWGNPFKETHANDPIFAFTRGNGANVSSVIIDGVTYTAEDGTNVRPGDVVYIKQALFVLEEGEESHIFNVTIKYSNLPDFEFDVKVVKGKPAAPSGFVFMPLEGQEYRYEWATYTDASSYKITIVKPNGETEVIDEIGNPYYNIEQLGEYENGTYTIELVAIVNGEESEKATLQYVKDGTPKPDIIVSEFKIEQENYKVGDIVKVLVTVKNIGDGAAIIDGVFNPGGATAEGNTYEWAQMILHLRQIYDGADTQSAYSGFPLPKDENGKFVFEVGETVSLSFNYEIPANAEMREYKIYLHADAVNHVNNERSDNNNKSIQIAITPDIVDEAEEIDGIQDATLENLEGNVKISWEDDLDTTRYVVRFASEDRWVLSDEIVGNEYSFSDNDYVLNYNSKVQIIAVDGTNAGKAIAKATALPDLKINKVYSNPAFVGMGTRIIVEYENVGTSKATGYMALMIYDVNSAGKFVGDAHTTPFIDLEPNKTAIVDNSSFTPNALGNATVEVLIDATGNIIETNEDNNGRQALTFEVLTYGDVKLTSPEEGSNAVKITWKAVAGVEEYDITYVTNGVAKIGNDALHINVSDPNVTYNSEDNTYSTFITDPLDHSTGVYVYAINGELESTIVGADIAYVNFIIKEITEPEVLNTNSPETAVVSVGRQIRFYVTIKNIGTAQRIGAPEEYEKLEGLEYTKMTYPYVTPVIMQWEGAGNTTGEILNDFYNKTILAGQEETLELGNRTNRIVKLTKEGDTKFTFRVNHIGWAAGLYTPEITDDDNTEVVTINVKPYIQDTAMDWTSFYASGNNLEEGEEDVNIGEDGKPIVCIANGSDWSDVQFKILDTSIKDLDYVDVISEYFAYNGTYLTLRFDSAEGHFIVEGTNAQGITDMQFVQVYGSDIENFDKDKDYWEGIVNSVDNDGVLNDYTYNGINIHTRSFARGKYYLIKLQNEDGSYATIALRVPGNLDQWVQAKASDNTDENALPFLYHRSDLETNGSFYYDGRDLGLATINCYNGNWLVVTVDGTRHFNIEDEDGWHIRLRYAGLDENGNYVNHKLPYDEDIHISHIQDEQLDFVTLEPGEAGLRNEGKTQIHIMLPSLIEQIPIHSSKGGLQDDEYYYMEVYYDNINHPGEFVPIPIKIVSDIPEIKPITGLAASLRGEELGVVWDNPDPEYKYDVYIQHECEGEYVLLKENATVEDIYSADVNGKNINFDKHNNIKVVETWCEQAREAEYLFKTDIGEAEPGVVPPSREDKWILISGEYNLPVTDHLKGEDGKVNANIYYYTDVDITNVVGYNGEYIAINGNTDYFSGVVTKLSIQKDGEERLTFEPVRIYDKLYPGQIQMNAAKMFETYGEYADGYTWKGTETIYYTIRVYGEDGAQKDFYFKIVPNEPVQTIPDAGKWVPLKGESTLPVTYKYVYNYTITDFDGNEIPMEENRELVVDGYIEYYDHQSITHTYTATGYNSYFMSLVGQTDIYSGAGTVKLGIANTTSDETTLSDMDGVGNAYMITEQDYKAGTLDYEESVIYDQLYKGEIQLNASQVFNVTHEKTYFMLEITGTTLDAEGNEVVVTRHLPVRITVKTGDVEVRAFQMNTNTAEGAVSEFNPSFRTVSRTAKIMTNPANTDDPSKLFAVVNFGTLYAVNKNVQDDKMVLNANGVEDVRATEKGVLANWAQLDEDIADDAESAGVDFDTYKEKIQEDYTYYAVTFKSITYYLHILTFSYKLRAYAILDDGSIVYQSKPAPTTSIYDIADVLYNESRMETKEAHDFLYDHVLNIVAISQNRQSIGDAMFYALKPSSPQDEKFILMSFAFDDLLCYTYLKGEYGRYNKYSEREEFRALTKYGEDADGDGVLDEVVETYLIPYLNEATGTNYETVADWIYNEVEENGFYRKIEWTDPNSGNQNGDDLVGGENI